MDLVEGRLDRLMRPDRLDCDEWLPHPWALLTDPNTGYIYCALGRVRVRARIRIRARARVRAS